MSVFTSVELSQHCMSVIHEKKINNRILKNDEIGVFFKQDINI